MNVLNARKSPDVEVDDAIGATRIANHQITRRYFKLGNREAQFLLSLDGTKTDDELKVGNVQEFNSREVEKLLQWFRSQGLVATETTPPVKAVTVIDRAKAFFIGPDAWRIHLFDPNSWMNSHLNIISPLFSRKAAFCYLLIFLAPLIVFLILPQSVSSFSIRSPGHFSINAWLILYGSAVLTIALHELAHAVACKFYGGNVYKIGVKLLYLQPVVFCDISDSWRFASRNAKIAVAAAGLFVQMLLTSIALTMWMVTNNELLIYFVFFNVVVCITNLFPLIKLDGYWILVHALDQPNLRTNAFRALDASLRRLLRPTSDVPGPSSAALVLFGAGSAASVVLFFLCGLFTIAKYAAYISDDFSRDVVVCALLFVAYRFFPVAATYVNSFRNSARPL